MLYRKLTIPLNLPKPYNEEIGVNYSHVNLIHEIQNSSKINENSIINSFDKYFTKKISSVIQPTVFIFLNDIVPIIYKSKQKDEGLYQLLRFLDNNVSNFIYLEDLINRNFIYVNLSKIFLFSGYLTNLISEDIKLLDILDPDYAMRLNGNITFYQNTFDKIDINISDEETVLDNLRKNHRFLKFQILFALIQGDIDIKRASYEFSLLAQATLNITLQIVENQINKKYNIKCDQYCIIAYGRFGTFTMTANSDLDLVFIHNNYINSHKSNRHIYIDLFRKVIKILSTKTKEGILYEVDTKLKPSGKYGPVASTFTNFKNYQVNKSFSWEKIALKKTRIVSTKNEFSSQISKLTNELNLIPISYRDISNEIRLMRVNTNKPLSNESIIKRKSPSKWFETKYTAGGQRDIEFVRFFFQDKLIFKNTHEIDEKILLLEKMEKLFFKLDQIMNICFLDEKQDNLPSKAINLLNSATDEKDLGSLKSSVKQGKNEIYNVLNQILERVEDNF